MNVEHAPCARMHYFFFGFGLLLVEDLDLDWVAGMVFFPDLHPHVLHILTPFRKEPGSAWCHCETGP